MEHEGALFKNNALIVFAKTPDSRVKTRIARSAGADAAQRIYREMIDVTAASIRTIPCHIAYTGGDSPGPLVSLFDNVVSWFEQEGDDLGARMKNACLHCARAGFSGCIVIGCDCPERPLDDIVQAARALESGVDVVLGPASDGGYHLAGVTGIGLGIFDVTDWSTDTVLRQTLDIAQKLGLKTLLLEPRSDIDTMEDYLRWKKTRPSSHR